MKCDQTEKKILLAQSGELGFIGRRRLARHLAGCLKCSAYQKDLLALTGLVQDRAEAADIRESVIEQVLAMAKRESSRSYEVRFRPSHEPAARKWRFAILYSALSVLLLVGLILVTLPHRQASMQTASAPAAATWEDNFDEEITALGSDMQLAMSEDWMNSSAADENNGDDIDSIARELLTMEGQKI